MRTNLCKDGKMKTYQVHRLVALAYLENPEGKATVNHKDEIKTHNYLNNLEWMTQAENIRYGTRTQRQAETLRRQYAAAAV